MTVVARRPRLLDLFCGAGGAAMGYHRAGFDVVGVDIVKQPNYPFEFHWGDAQDVLESIENGGHWYWEIGEPDAIHASPPCQAFSSKTRKPGRHGNQIDPIRHRLAASGLPYVIENVPGAPLIDPVLLCGSMFGLGVRRHRLFESTFPILTPVCAHGSQPPRYRIYDHGRWYESPVVHVFGTGGGKGREHWADAMGIDWMTDDELAESIPPAYTELIGHQLVAHLEAVAA